MLKLVSAKGRWSFLNGYQIYGNVVWLSNREEANKYTLIDENGNKLDVNVEDYIVEEKNNYTNTKDYEIFEEI